MASYIFLPEESWVEEQLERITRVVDGWREAPKVCGVGQGWVRHLHECSLTNIIPSRGCLTLILRGAKILPTTDHSPGSTLPRGSLVFFNAGENISCTNSLGNSADFLAFTISFEEDTVRRALSRLPQQSPTDQANWPRRLMGGLEQFLNFLAGEPDQILAAMQQEQILYLLWNCGFFPFSFPEPLVTQIRALVESEPAGKWAPALLAERLHLSERTLRRRLTKAGWGCSELVRLSRLHVGLSLLQTGSLRVGEVAYQCGYESASRFSERFREQFKVTPTEILQGREVK